jgi:hypothetical protein
VTHTYGISPVRRNILIGVGLVLSLPFAIGAAISSEPALIAVAVLVSAIVLPILLIAWRSARLVVSEEGIEVRQLGMRLSTSWNNIAALRMVKGSEGIVLHRPLEGKGAGRLAASAGVRVAGAPLYDADRQSLIAEHRFIPIEPFAYWLERGNLREVLQTHIPAGVTWESEPRVAPKGMTRSRRLVAMAIIAASLAWGVAMALASPETQQRLTPVITIPAGLALLAFAAGNGLSAARHLKCGNVAWFLLWGAMAVVQALAGVGIIGTVL